MFVCEGQAAWEDGVLARLEGLDWAVRSKRRPQPNPRRRTEVDKNSSLQQTEHASRGLSICGRGGRHEEDVGPGAGSTNRFCMRRVKGQHASELWFYRRLIPLAIGNSEWGLRVHYLPIAHIGQRSDEPRDEPLGTIWSLLAAESASDTRCFCRGQASEPRVFRHGTPILQASGSQWRPK